MIHDRTGDNMAAVNVQIACIALIVVVKRLMLCTEVVTLEGSPLLRKISIFDNPGLRTKQKQNSSKRTESAIQYFHQSKVPWLNVSKLNLVFAQSVHSDRVKF